MNPKTTLLAFGALITSVMAEPTTTRLISECEYGRRVRYVNVTMRYPDFIVSFVKREDNTPPGTNLGSVSYVFDVLDKKDKKVSSFTFTMSGMFESTRVFEVVGKSFIAEMFDSTAGQPSSGGIPPKRNSALPHDEIIIWDESAAKTGNLQLAEIWKKIRITKEGRPTATNVLDPLPPL